MQARKTLLFHDVIPLVKKLSNEDFDMAMGSYDGTEVSELVCAFLLNNLGHVIDETGVGLYRDNGLVVSQSHSGPETERKWKEIIKILET